MTHEKPRTRNIARALAVAALALTHAGQAAAAPPAADAESQRPATTTSSVGFSLMGGVMAPLNAQSAAGPSLRALVLYQPVRTLGIGVTGQIARHHWRATYVPYGPAGTPEADVEADLTTAFAGAAARWTIVPDWVVSPLLELDLGVATQGQSGSNFSCNNAAYPTGQLGVGARAQLSRSWSVFAMGSASGGIKGTCGVSDGPPATPFAAWGYGLQIGAGFDLGLGAGPARNLAAR